MIKEITTKRKKYPGKYYKKKVKYPIKNAIKLKKREFYMNIIHYTQNTNYNIKNVIIMWYFYYSFEYYYL